MSKQPKPKPAKGPRSLPTSRPALIGGMLALPTRVFINYRRQDTGPAAEHLHASLAKRLGSERIFRDLATIEPGQDFPAVIDQAIRATSVFIVLIGRRWLTIKGRNGRRRLDDPKDFVRLEIESALRQGVTVIPLRVDGAKMPTREELPASIADLAERHGYELPWHEVIVKLGHRIAEVERERAERDAAERAERERLDLTRGFKKTAASDVVIRAMEMSLRHQDHSVLLDPKDLDASIKKVTGRHVDEGFLFSDLVYVIDVIGVKAKGSNQRYIARSYPLSSLDELPVQLKLGRPVLAGVIVYDLWEREPFSKTGLIELKPGDDQGHIIGGTVGALVAWEPRKEQLKLLTSFPKWGDHGMFTLNRAAAKQSLDVSQLRSVEAVLMPEPPSTAGLPSAGKPHRKRPK